MLLNLILYAGGTSEMEKEIMEKINELSTDNRFDQKSMLLLRLMQGD